LGREFQIVWAGRREQDRWESLCGEYRNRIGRFMPIRERIVKAPPARDDPSRRLLESQALRRTLPEPSWVIALDRRGRQLSSMEFARRISKLREEWPHPLVFVLGSDLGLEPGLLKSAQERLSLGKMTLPHNLARLVLYEQIYRALSIGAGSRYHRGPL
jgi:23S rRNA (pseudouridine1915-N3)-methyltransferase